MTDPSTIASTLNSRAISGRAFFAPLYCMTEVREMTRRDLTLARSVINWSVMPSAKNSSDGSPDRLSRGRTGMSTRKRQFNPYSCSALANASLAVDDSIGEAYDTLGALSANFDWDWDTADREFKRAIALAPSYSCAREDRASFLALIGRRAEALAEMAKIDQLDYSFSSAWTEQWTYYNLRDYPSLIGASRRGLLLDPKVWFQH